jgi:hypothetical protein
VDPPAAAGDALAAVQLAALQGLPQGLPMPSGAFYGLGRVKPHPLVMRPRNRWWTRRRWVADLDQLGEPTEVARQVLEGPSDAGQCDPDLGS